MFWKYQVKNGQTLHSSPIKIFIFPNLTFVEKYQKKNMELMI